MTAVTERNDRTPANQSETGRPNGTYGVDNDDPTGLLRAR